LKIIADTTCPGCKKNHEVEIDIDKLDVKTPPASTTNASSSQTTILEEEPPEVIEKEVIKTVIEDFKPNYECPDGDCDIGVHKNKNFKKMPKGKCTNCDQFTKHDKGTCPWCKHDEIEPIEPEELDELGIDTPNIEEHEEHIHE